MVAIMAHHCLRFLAIALALSSITVSTLALANNFPDPLENGEVKALSHTARMLYARAMKEMNHIRYDRALDLVNDAAEADPQNNSLQMYNAQTHKNRARVKKMEIAQEYYKRAIQSLENILNNPNSTEEELLHARSVMRIVKNDQEALPERIERRKETAKALREAVAARRAAPATLEGVQTPSARNVSSRSAASSARRAGGRREQDY